MANLASAADVADRLGRDLTSSEENRVEALLTDASAAVRVYTGRNFESGEQTVRLRVRNKRLRLSQRPVTGVASVTDIDGNDVPFQWDGLDVVEVWPCAYLDGWAYEPPRIFPPVVDVTYTAGPTTVPDAIVAVVSQVAARAFGLSPEDSGHQQESISGYSYSVGVAAAAGGVGLLNDERAVLDRYRRVGGVAQVGP